jgi:Uma2 family endonuclease
MTVHLRSGTANGYEAHVGQKAPMTLAGYSATRTTKSRGRSVVVDPDQLYPYSDGKPLAESEPHMRCIRWLLDAVEDVIRGRKNVAFHGDMFWYWKEGDPRKCRAPDVMVLYGVPMDPVRLSYKGWEHRGIVPSVIIETASNEQQAMLLGELKRDYERLGVREYFVFDWSGQYLEEPLYGFRLRGKSYQPIRPAKDGSMLSRRLDVKMRPEGRMLRFINPETGELVPTRDEQVAGQRTELSSWQSEAARLRDLLKKFGIDPDTAK